MLANSGATSKENLDAPLAICRYLLQLALNKQTCAEALNIIYFLFLLIYYFLFTVVASTHFRLF